METMLDRGYRVTGAVVNVVAVTGATAQIIYPISNFAGQIGTKTFKPRKLMVRNNAGGNLWLSLGTLVGGAFTNRLPPVRVLNNMDNEWVEYELPAAEFALDMRAFCDALIAGGSCDVCVEAEEVG